MLSPDRARRKQQTNNKYKAVCLARFTLNPLHIIKKHHRAICGAGGVEPPCRTRHIKSTPHICHSFVPYELLAGSQNSESQRRVQSTHKRLQKFIRHPFLTFISNSFLSISILCHAWQAIPFCCDTGRRAVHR